jgi:2-polyprenyl-3-methyl-5-hydroxy-6-metoxy-1,4-benzoquinol methylase
MDVATQAKYYDHYWATHRRALNYHEIVRVSEVIRCYAEVATSFPANKRPRICDLGCGRGWITDILSRFGDPVGVDFSADAIALAKSSFPNIAFVCANVLDFIAETKFDVVVSSEVIEHLDEQERYVRVIADILAPGGFLIMTCPNDLQQRAWDKVNPTRQPIENWLTPATLRKLLRRDFEVTYQSTFHLYFTLDGLRRVINAPKFLSAISSARLLQAFEGFRHTLGGGLYQIVVARRRGAPARLGEPGN